MASIAALRDALASRLIAAYAGTNIQVYDSVPGQINTPCVVVEPASGDYHQTLGSADQTMHQMSVIAIAFLGERAAAQDQIDALISNTGAQSIKAAIEGDRTLGGAALWCDASGYRDYGTREYSGQNYLMATVDVQLYAA